MALRPQEVYDRHGFFNSSLHKYDLSLISYESEVIFENPFDREKKRKNDLEDHLIKNHLDSNETKSLKVRCLSPTFENG